MIWNAEQNIQLRPAEGTSGESSICVPTSAGCFIGDKMKQIPLTQGKVAIVDDEDYERISKYKWYARWCESTQSFYAARASKCENGKRHPISMAREILGLTYGDKRQADHINHDTLNNRRVNLRIVTHQQNQWNHKNTKGYYLNKKSQKYYAQITLNSKRIHLGFFQLAKEAHTAYLDARKRYHKI